MTMIAVVIPSYKVKQHIAGLINRIGAEVGRIYVVDDACPEGSGDFVAMTITDPRVVILRHPQNMGVGGAVVTGYKAALADGADIVVKMDGDGQMPPEWLPTLISPILDGLADYTKGNRFFDVESVRDMPPVRSAGNAALSFVSKLSTGYWNTFDPTNGYTAIHANVLRAIPLNKLSTRYFFESDILFRLNTIGAVVQDVPMRAQYGDEVSGLRISRILLPFITGHASNFGKRLLYSYFIRGFSLASLELVIGLIMLFFGAVFGLFSWISAVQQGINATSGTVMLAALPVLTGTQLLLAFLGHDIASTPRNPINRRLARWSLIHD